MGGDAIPVTQDPASDEEPTCSPDGSRVAFHSDRGAYTDLWKIPSSGGTATPITSDPALEFCPSWSPDGSRISFSTDRSGSIDIWVIPVEGGPATQITTDPASDFYPSWSPDGSRIAFSSDRTGDNEIWVIEVGQTGIEEKKPGKVIPFTMHQNYPNPFNPTTTILFDLPSRANLSILLYDSRGRLVRTLSERRVWVAGNHRIHWDGKDERGAAVPSGLYFCTITKEGHSETRKMVLLK
jgi:Tol biopolymer transport system component